MKLKASTGRKLRYGGTSVALTAAIIAVVIILNVLFSLLVQRYGLYVDLTPDLHFTISDECYDLIGKIDSKDGTDTPIEMVEKFRAENDKLTAESKKKNEQIAADNAAAKKVNDGLKESLAKINEEYTPYEEYIPYKEYPQYSYDKQSTIVKLRNENEQIRKQNAGISERNAAKKEAYGEHLPESAEYTQYIEYTEDPTINIIFLTDKDTLENDSTTKYVVFNADDELRVKYPEYISVEYANAELNPARFTKYLNSPTDTIDYDSVIIECGSEFRVRTLRSFFVFENEETPTAYNGEKAFASSILAVTRAEAPLVCYTVNHGEKFPESTKGNETPFIQSLVDAGYAVDERSPLDLSKNEIPEECRLIVVFNPTYDFISDKDGINDVSELDKLEDFLYDRNSLMVFMSPNSHSGRLDNFEDFLEEWGLALRRNGDDPIIVKDSTASIMGNSSAVIAEYAKNPLARGWMANLLQSKPYIVFPDATAVTYPDNDIGGTAGFDRKWETDPEDETLQYYVTFGKDSNGDSRTVYDLFYSSPNAVGLAGGSEIASATEHDPFTLMSVSVQTYTEQEYAGTLQDSAFVMLCGSTEFASEKYLSSNTYGNSDFLLAALQMAGREPVPVGLAYKEFANYSIETITSTEATVYTVLLTVVPLLAAAVSGVVIIVRRKNR